MHLFHMKMIKISPTLDPEKLFLLPCLLYGFYFEKTDLESNKSADTSASEKQLSCHKHVQTCQPVQH